MKYVVLVREPVPSDLTAVVGEVAGGFRISPEKAMALLRRAPGVVTRPVGEREARVVAKILDAAGLVVEIREESADGRAVSLLAEEEAAAQPSSVPEAGGAMADEIPGGRQSGPGSARDGTAMASGQASTAGSAPAPAAGAPAATAAEPMTESSSATGADGPRGAGMVATAADDEPTIVTEPANAPETVIGRAATAAVRGADVAVDGHAPSRHPTASGRRTTVPGQTTTTPPRDPMKTTLTRNPPTLERGGLRRRVATAATLPAIVTLLVALLAVGVTMLPLVRGQQERRAAAVALSMATTIEGLAGGLPLSAPLLRAELARVGERSRQELAANGVAFLGVLDADGSTLMAWRADGASQGALPEDALVLARARATTAAPAVAPTTWTDDLRASGRTALAVLGLATEEPMVAAASVQRLGTPVGAVVVGVASDVERAAAAQVFRTVALVGLIPVLFAVLAALSLTRGLTDAIGYLLVATDRISHGDFERPVELSRDDELGQIAKGVERMRVSLREGMERLRRRR
ncbi:MAG: HAMP domain-containing protein [Trueperaceae bacterium]